MRCFRLFAGCLALGAVLLAAGCASPRYAPGPYKPDPVRFGAIPLPAGGRTVVVCPVIDRLTAENREALKPDFTPWTYVTDAIEAELREAGLKPVRAAFAFGPSFDALREAVKAQPAGESARCVYLGTELLYLSPPLWILDAELIDPRGNTLFGKRALSSVWGNLAVDEQQVIHMLIRQVLADPRFREALP